MFRIDIYSIFSMFCFLLIFLFLSLSSLDVYLSSSEYT